MTTGELRAAKSSDVIEYSEIIQFRDLSVPFVPSIITPNIEKPLRKGRYEVGELVLLAEIIRPDDRVLDLGGGLGLVAATASRAAQGGAVLCVEAHPDLAAMIQEVWKLNGIDKATLRSGLIAPTGGGQQDFYVRADFWASSLEAESRPFERKIKQDVIGIDELIRDFQPTVISCDVEGAELGLFDDVDLSGVREMIIETHPKVYGTDGRSELLKTLSDKGLPARYQESPSTVYHLDRSLSADSAFSSNVELVKCNPRVLVATCMKDEGPFILEWLSWHKAIGVTDFVIFSNDCTDGTDKLLDLLDERGEITHLTNPAVAIESTYFQPVALRYVQTLPVFRRCDFFLSMDVDEFVNIGVGDGTVQSLLEAVDPFDVLSMCELNHGANGNKDYERGWVTELFPLHANPWPGKWKARVGVKSLVRISPRIPQMRNHRPDIATIPEEVVWLDGSGNPIYDLAEDASQNGTDCRGKRDLATIEHFALRSLDSFMVKAFRGDVVNRERQVSFRYWRVRNRNDFDSHDLSDGVARAKKIYSQFEADLELMEQHEHCCAAHEARIKALHTEAEYQDFKQRILDGAW